MEQSDEYLAMHLHTTHFAPEDGNSHQILCHNRALRLQLCLPLLLLGRIQLGALAKAVKRAKDTVVVLLLMMTMMMMKMKMKMKMMMMMMMMMMVNIIIINIIIIIILYVRVCVGVSTSEKDRLTAKRSEKCSSATRCSSANAAYHSIPSWKRILMPLLQFLFTFPPVPGIHDI